MVRMISPNGGGSCRLTALVEFNTVGFIHQDLKCANIVVDESNNIRIIDLENAGGTLGWVHPDDRRGYVANDGVSPVASMNSVGDEYPQKVHVGTSHSIVGRESTQPSESDLLRTCLN